MVDTRTPIDKLNYMKARYNRLKEEHLCTSCRKPAAEGRTLCVLCLDKYKERSSENRRVYKRLGLCPMCQSNRVQKDHVLCTGCLEKKRIEYAKLRASLLTDEAKNAEFQTRQRECGKKRRAMRLSEGLCYVCGIRPHELGRTRCALCLKKESDDKRKLRLKKGIAKNEPEP